MTYSFQHQGHTISPVSGFMDELKSLIPDSARNFLEWGAGCSTLLFQDLAKERNGSVLTMEDDPNFLTSVSRSLDYSGSHIVLQDLMGPRTSQKDAGTNYATYPVSTNKKFDFIMIDGRRRVECAIAALSVLHQNTTIILHD